MKTVESLTPRSKDLKVKEQQQPVEREIVVCEVATGDSKLEIRRSAWSGVRAIQYNE